MVAMEALQHRYEHVIRWALGHRKTVLFGAIGLFVASMFLFPLIGSEFVPKEDQSEFGMRLETPVGSSLDYDRQGCTGGGRAQENPEIKAAVLRCGWRTQQEHRLDQRDPEAAPRTYP